LGRPIGDRAIQSERVVGGVVHTRKVDAADVVEMAGRLPEVVLKEHSAWTSITFKGKGFGWVNHAEDTVMLKSSHDERAAMLATNPEVFSAGWASATTAWVSIRLDLADPAEVFEILAEGWRMTATKRAIAEYDAHVDAIAGSLRGR